MPKIKKENAVVRAIKEYMPDSIIGRVTRFGLLLFVCGLPIYTYQTFISDTPRILTTECSQIKDLSPQNQERINELMKHAGGKNTVPVCTLLPVPSTDKDLSEIGGIKQLFHYPIPFFGSIYYYLATNVLIFVSLAFLYSVIVLGNYPALGRTLPRQLITTSAVFLIATNILIPTAESVQYATLSQNAVNRSHLAVDNRLLCDTEHVFNLLKKHNAIPTTQYGYQIVELENKPYNAIVCHGSKLNILDKAPVVEAKGFKGLLVQYTLNFLVFLLISLALVGFLTLYKHLLHRIINR